MHQRTSEMEGGNPQSEGVETLPPRSQHFTLNKASWVAQRCPPPHCPLRALEAQRTQLPKRPVFTLILSCLSSARQRAIGFNGQWEVVWFPFGQFPAKPGPWSAQEVKYRGGGGGVGCLKEKNHTCPPGAGGQMSGGSPILKLPRRTDAGGGGR